MKSILSNKEALRLALKLSYILRYESEDNGIAGEYSYLFKKKEVSDIAKNIGKICGYNIIEDDKMYTFTISGRPYVICMYDTDVQKYYPMEAIVNDYDSSGTIFIFIDSQLEDIDNESVLRGLYNIFSTFVYPDRSPNTFTNDQLGETINSLLCIFLIYMVIKLSYNVNDEFEESIKKVHLFGYEYDEMYKESVLKLYSHIIPSYITTNLKPEYENEIEYNFQNKFETLADILPYITNSMYASDKSFFD